MKVKKLFKFLNSICSENNCQVGKCPFAEWGDESHRYSNCLIRNETDDQWNIKKILLAVRTIKKMKNVKTKRVMIL